jgi:hypothetical protein
VIISRQTAHARPGEPGAVPTRRAQWRSPASRLTWTEDNLLRQVVYEGLREDKPAAGVRREVPYPKPAEPKRPAT